MFSTLFGSKSNTKLSTTTTVELSPENKAGWQQVRVNVYNGSIQLRQWDNQYLQATIHVTVKGQLAEEITEDQTDRFWNLEGEGQTVVFEQVKLKQLLTSSSVQVSVELFVPQHLNAELHTHNGPVAVIDCLGELEATTHNGEIVVKNHTGDTKLHTHNGKVYVERVQGELIVSSHNGGLHLSGIDGRIKGETHNGGIRLANCHNDLDLVTHNGKITLANQEVLAGDWNMVTHKGSIELTMPKDIDAHLKLKTSLGKINGGDLLPFTSTGASQQMQATLGQGKRSIRLKTSLGSIHLKASV
ncbi:MAG TPA: DUF4097 family beta strand repeat-containing protein [Bacilli bacterium]|nr:DUF4097 family beta strand repeat-containing protein [Bacilli bacterium]